MYEAGAITGSQLGEAAHRLVKNTLNIKWNDTSHGLLEQPPVRHTINKFHSAGPSGHGKYHGENTNSYYGEHNHHGIMTRQRYPISSNGEQMHRQDFRIQDRSRHQEQLQNLKTGFSALTMEERLRPKPSSALPISGPTTNLEPRFVQNTGSSVPAPKWKNKAPINGMYTGRQDASGAVNHKQIKVYKVKSRLPQETPDSGNQ